MVPKPIRDRIWATYRDGQCDDMNPSDDYCTAARDAVIAVARKEGREPDTRLYDLFLAAAQRPDVAADSVGDGREEPTHEH